MPVVRIEHTVPNIQTWKKAFDRDPADRKGSGVRHYRLLRHCDNPEHVFVDLEFDTLEEAKSFLDKMRRIWEGPARAIAHAPRAYIAEPFESKSLLLDTT